MPGTAYILYRTIVKPRLTPKSSGRVSPPHRVDDLQLVSLAHQIDRQVARHLKGLVLFQPMFRHQAA